MSIDPQDSFAEVTSQSRLGRLGESIKSRRRTSIPRRERSSAAARKLSRPTPTTRHGRQIPRIRAVPSSRSSSFNGVTGNDPESPQVGDLRIRFRVVKPAVVSILAKQSGETFAVWRSHSGTEVERLIPGTVDAQGMVQVMERENTMLKWILPVAGSTPTFNSPSPP